MSQLALVIARHFIGEQCSFSLCNVFRVNKMWYGMVRVRVGVKFKAGARYV